MSERPRRERKKPQQEEAAGPPPKFEAALARLEEIAERLESGEPPLEEAIALAEEGQRLVQLCEKQLTEAEGKIQQLVEPASGGVSLEPLEAQDEEVE